MRVTVSVAVAGASGYAGGEAARLVLGHPELELRTMTAHRNAGESVAATLPHLAAHPSIGGRVFEATSTDSLAGHDVVILALPHGASGAVAAELETVSPDTVVLDLGADHRLTDAAAWRAFYGTEHAGSWAYGMPELLHAGESVAQRQRAELATTTRIAVPGCNVTAVTLALGPGIAAGVIDAADVVATLAVGYSGAGRLPKPHLQFSEAHGVATPYAVGGTHRHIPEIVQNLTVAGASEVRLAFTPVLVPLSRGILATVSVPVAPSVSEADLRAAWETAYADEPFVHLLPVGQWPSTAASVGANTAHVQVGLDAAAGRAVVICAIDNLVKGTAGAALQSLNLALGLAETTGLPLTGLAP